MKPRRNDNSLYSLRKKANQARSKAMVDAILTAATMLLLDIGYDKANTNKIAELAGVSIGSLYRYFPGKEAVFAEVLRREDRRLFDLSKVQLETPSTVSDWMRQHASLYLNYIRSNLPLHVALLNEVPRQMLRRDDLFVSKYYVPWLAGFLDSHRESLLPLGNSTEEAALITNLMQAAVENYIVHSPEKLSDPEFEERLVTLILRYLLKPSQNEL